MGTAIVLVVHKLEKEAWSERVSDAGQSRFRIVIAREAYTGVGEGDFNRRFGDAARRTAAERSCAGYRVVSYNERLESMFIFARRLAEGVVECL